MNASEGVLVGFIGSKGPRNKDATHTDLLSALGKNGSSPALKELHANKKNALAHHASRKASADLKMVG